MIKVRALLASFVLVFGFTALFGWTAAFAQETATKAFTIDWATLLPVLVAAAAPMLTGMLQQVSKKFSEAAPWYAKWAVTAVIGGVLGWITSFAATGDQLLGASGGAVIGTLGSLNIALRKGAGRFFDVTLEPPSASGSAPK